MNEVGSHLGVLKELTWSHVLLVVAVLVGSRLLIALVRWTVRRAAEAARSNWRLLILRTAPLARLLIGIGAIVTIIPILVEPTFEDIVALFAAVGLALGFALKDYVSCLVAGVVTILERPISPVIGSKWMVPMVR